MVAATQEVASVSKISIKDVSSKEVVLSAEIPWSLQACKTRAVLTKQQAIRIFEIKLASNSGGIEQPSAQLTAHHFGVSEKAIRDIWKGRTWIRETMHLDPKRVERVGLLRLPGRPRKSKQNRGIKANEALPAKQPKSTAFTNPSSLPKQDENSNLLFPMTPIQPDWVWVTWPELEPLPESSTEEDPFHDDWPHWPHQETTAVGTLQKYSLPAPSVSP